MMQPPPPPLPPSLPTSSNSNVIAEYSSSSAVVKSSKKKDNDSDEQLNSPSPIFHVLLLPGGNIQKEDPNETTKKRPNVVVIVDDYLYQRHVYRNKAAARRLLLLRTNDVGGSGGAAKKKSKHDEMSLNKLASPLEIALASCCVRPTTTTAAAANNNEEASSALSLSLATQQRSRLHRPVMPSNADDEEEDDDVGSHTNTDNNITAPLLLDKPRNISMKPHPKQLNSNEVSSSSSSSIGTLAKGQETHFLKLLQMYCPSSSQQQQHCQNDDNNNGDDYDYYDNGLMYRSLAVEILQRTVDWETTTTTTTGGATTANNKKKQDSNNTTPLTGSSSSSSSNKEQMMIGQIGYTFRKQFHSGWYIGNVTEILPLPPQQQHPATNNTTTAAKDRRCVYNDGDVEDLSLEELKKLAELEELDHRYHHHDSASFFNSTNNTTTAAKDRRCVYNDGDVEDLSLEELKKLAELEELDHRYHHHDDHDDDDHEQKKSETAAEEQDNGDGTSSGDVKLEEGEGNNASTAAAAEVVVTTPPPPTVSSSSNDHTVMKTFLAIGGMKLLARWLVEAYTVVQPPPSSSPPNKRRSSSQNNKATEAAVSPSPTGALLLPLLTLLKSIPFDKDIIVASSIHKYIKRYKKALDKLSKKVSENTVERVNYNNIEGFVHPIAGGGSVRKVLRGVEEVMTSWNNATAALSAKTSDDHGSSRSEKTKEKLDPYMELRDQLQSRFDELAAFHNNRTNPPEWVPKHVLGVVMASPKAAPSSPTLSKPTINTNSSSLKSNNQYTSKINNEWGTNRASAAQLARERFLEGFRKQKDAVSSPTGTIAGLLPGNKWTGSPPEKMQKVAHGDVSSSRKVCWVDNPMGRKGVSPQPLVTERVLTRPRTFLGRIP